MSTRREFVTRQTSEAWALRAMSLSRMRTSRQPSTQKHM